MKDILLDYKEKNEFIFVIIVSNPPKEEELFHYPDNSEIFTWVVQQLGLEEFQ